MPPYKKKVPTIIAEQFGEGQEPLPDGVVQTGPSSFMLMFENPEADIAAGGSGGSFIEIDDWIVTYSDGARFRYPPDVFDVSFELDDTQ